MSPKKPVHPDKDLHDASVITSIQELIGKVSKDFSTWDRRTKLYFRGEPRDIPSPLLPKLFRSEHDETRLLQEFRMRSPALGLDYVPPRGFTDQWLFLAQHVRLPTRLLDWTEGLLIALHFALYSQEDGGVIWMLNPDALNQLTHPAFEPGQNQLTWYSPHKGRLTKSDLFRLEELSTKSQINDDVIVPSEGELGIRIYNITTMNINYAWTQKGNLTPFPWAIPPTNIHPRMSSQASRFTIHGKDSIGMNEMDLGPEILRRYEIADEAIPDLKDELRMMGITHSSLFPELDGLSDELAEIY